MKRRPKIASSKAFARILPAGLSGNVAFFGFLVFLSVVLMMLSALKPNVAETIRVSAMDAVRPFIEALNAPIQNAAALTRDVSGLAVMQAENERLKAENVRLREWYQNALMLEAENKSLRELMSVKAPPEQTVITARVLSDAGNAFAKTVMVAAGRADGVEKGHAVMSGQGVIGRIIEVGEATSRVLLVTDINSRVPVLIADTNQHAILSGLNKSHAQLLHVPPESVIREGAQILTSGHGGVFPANLPIGVVTSSQEGQVQVRPLSDLSQVVFVRIIDHKADPNLRRGGLLGN